jgi:hypothetical protein
MALHLCEAITRPEHKIDWNVADERVTYVKRTG